MELFETVLSYVLITAIILLSVFWLIVYFDVFRENEKLIKIRRYPKIGVIIPTLYEGKFLKNSVQSVLKSKYPRRKYTIYIGLNQKTDAATRKVADSFKESNVKVIDTGLNGKAAVMNYIIKNSLRDEKLILTLDADSIIEKTLMERLIIPFIEEKNVGAVAPSMLIYKPKNVLEILQKYEYIFNTALRKGLSNSGTLLVAPGPGSLLSRKAIERVGYYDETSIVEDMDLTTKMLIAGYKVENRLDAKSYTAPPDTLKKYFRQRIRWYAGSFYNIIKYRRQLTAKRKDDNIDRGVISLTLISSVLSLAVLPIVGFYLYYYLNQLFFILTQLGSSFSFNFQNFLTSIIFGFNELSFAAIIAVIISLYSVFYLLKNINKGVAIIKDGFWSIACLFVYGYLLAITWTLGFFKSLMMISESKWNGN